MPLTVSNDIDIKSLHLGLFEISIKGTESRPYLQVSQKVSDNGSPKILLQSLPNQPFIQTATGEDDFTEGYGTFQIIDHDFYLTDNQSITDFAASSTVPILSTPIVTIKGTIRTSQSSKPITYKMTFTNPIPTQLRFEISITDPSTRFNKVFLTFGSTRLERIAGFGEQLTHWDLKGQKIPIMTREDGVGRGLQPTTFFVNTFFGTYAGGDTVSAYKPVPHFITTELRAFFLENYDYSMFDLTSLDKIRVKVGAPVMVGRIYAKDTPLKLIEEFTKYAGRMRPMPDWALEGAIAGIQGGEEKVNGIVDKALTAGVPLTAVWLQDWCGKREQKVLGRVLKRLWWNWESDDALYPNWPTFVESLSKKNVNVLTYVNSFLADVELGSKPSFRRNLFREAAEKNYLVRNETNTGPLKINSGPNFQAGLVDLLNPEAYSWLKQVMITNAFAEKGVKGYMSDFAEFLPPGAYLTNGKVATSGDHNRYSELWGELQREVLDVVGGEDKVIFHRSGYTKSPGSTSLFWTGDQLVSWDEYDGIKAGLVGLLTSGLSGMSMNHSDIGGYSGLTLQVMGKQIGNFRTKELLMRWMELAAFGVVFRSHEGSMPQVNCQFYDDDETLAHFARNAKIFASLAPYKKILMKESSTLGYPLIRHMFLHFHTDKDVWDLKKQFLLGPSLLVAPVLDPSTASVKVYLPLLPKNQKWINAYTLKPADVESYPAWVTVDAPMGRSGLFVVESSAQNGDSGTALFETLIDRLKPILINYLKQNDAPHIIEPAQSLLKPSELRSLFPRNMQLPSDGVEMDELVEIINLTLQNSTRTGSPRFLDKLYAGTDPVGQISELLTSILNTNVHVYSVSPVFTLMELTLLRHTASLLSFDLPSGILQPGGSASNMLAMITARARLYPKHRTLGAAACGEILTVFTSEASHYSIDKSAASLGIGLNHVVKVPVTSDGRMIPSELKRLLEENIQAGQKPFFVNATSGTTVLSAFDPLDEIVSVVRQVESKFNIQIWIHTDGSYGGCVAFSKQRRETLLRGVQDVDSFTMSPHKILGVPMQCSMLLVNGKRWGRKVLWESNGLKASYLFHGSETQEQSDVDPSWEGEEDGGFMYDLGDATVGCGRRADSLKLFLSWTFHGQNGWTKRIEHAFELTLYLTNLLQGHPEKFQLVLEDTDPKLSVSFWCIPHSLLDRFGSLDSFKTDHPNLFLKVFNESTRLIHTEMTKRGKFMVDFMSLSKPFQLPRFLRVAISSPLVDRKLLEELVEEVRVLTERLDVEFGEEGEGGVVVVRMRD
ncbi:hypothetical protein HDV05_000174 [Chytridiales sp. JEL 0842]|nr:hypothetical protein HDV05_000174 [Chytridiales sp. JEL 0842]